MSELTAPLALFGSGEFEPWTESVERAVLERAGSGNGTVAIVPTASALEGATFDAWAEKGLRHYATLGIPARVVPVRSRADADRPDLASDLQDVSMIFFSGGNPAYLASTLAGSGFWAGVVDRLREGAVYAGCSAGACVAGSFAPESMTDRVWESGWSPGLEVLANTWILPHFDALDRHRDGLREFFLSHVPETEWALGIDEQTAVVRLGDRWEVMGRGGAFVARGPSARRWLSGEAFSREDLDREGGADRALVLTVESLGPGSGPVALLSGEQFSSGAAEADVRMLERCGPRVGLVLEADPSNAEVLERTAIAHYRSLDADPVRLRPGDGADGVDVLFLAGGDPRNLVSSLGGSRLWRSALTKWRIGMGLAGSSAGAMALCAHCLFADAGKRLPARWDRGLGPLESFAVAPHAATRPEGWLEAIVASAPVDVLALDDDATLLLCPGRPPEVLGSGIIRPLPAGSL